MELSQSQIQIIESPLNSQTFLSGPAGTGKSSAGIERLKYLLQAGLPGHEILLLFPQRNLSTDYLTALDGLDFSGSSKPVFATYGGLTRRGIELFWPIYLKNFPEFSSESPPVFLTLESSLYFLSKLVEPLILDEGYFSSVTIQRNRLYSQILDNLNKAAVHGFPHTEIAERLLSAWIGDQAQSLVYEHAQLAANLFRNYCYENNLLDFSLQVELFSRSLKSIPLVPEYFQSKYHYLIYDNSEEDFPVCHDFVSSLLPSLDSALLIFDEDAGYRSFLGASPSNAMELSSQCEKQVRFVDTFTNSEDLLVFSSLLKTSLDRSSQPSIDKTKVAATATSVIYRATHPQMVSSVAENISSLIKSGTSPSEIVILAPFLSDALRFMFATELTKHGISHATHRPSRALRDEPVTLCLLTLAAFAHPQWKIQPSIHDLTYALLQSIDDLDLTRAYILSRQSLKNKNNAVGLSDFESLPSSFQERITYYFGNRYQELNEWLVEYSEQPPLPLDHFFVHLFGEILSQPGFGFRDDTSMAAVTNQIILSVQKFRMSAGAVQRFNPDQLGSEYYRMVKTGVLANQYLQSWSQAPDDSVYLAPAYTFLLNNRPVDYQFWLDVGSRGWYERIFQPLTNPHILHRDWQIGNPWRDVEEQILNLESLTCLTTGLIRRCRKGISLCLTKTDEHGYEQKGLLIQALNEILNNRRMPE
jgi:hypothetical protein